MNKTIVGEKNDENEQGTEAGSETAEATCCNLELSLDLGAS